MNKKILISSVIGGVVIFGLAAFLETPFSMYGPIMVLGLGLSSKIFFGPVIEEFLKFWGSELVSKVTATRSRLIPLLLVGTFGIIEFVLSMVLGGQVLTDRIPALIVHLWTGVMYSLWFRKSMKNRIAVLVAMTVVHIAFNLFVTK